MNLYVSTYGARVGISGGRLIVKDEDTIIANYPLNSVDSMSLYTGVNISPALIKEFSDNCKNIFWINSLGRTYACIAPPGAENVMRRKKQFLITDNDAYCLAMAKQFISAKISNSLRVLSKYKDIEQNTSVLCTFSELSEKLLSVETIDEVMGVEGLAAKTYFSELSEILPEKLAFTKRTRQPPRDCFSSAISFAYMLLHNDYVAAIQGAGLDPNVGIMHQLKSSHYALASDLMEELRAPLCDDIVIQLFNSGTLNHDDFDKLEDGAVYLGTKSSKKLIAAYEEKVRSETGIKKKKGTGLDWKSLMTVQVHELIKSIETSDSLAYHPIYIG